MLRKKNAFLRGILSTHAMVHSFALSFLYLFIWVMINIYWALPMKQALCWVLGVRGEINRHRQGSKDSPRSSSNPLIHLLMFISDMKYNGQTAAGMDLNHPSQLGDMGRLLTPSEHQFSRLLSISENVRVHGKDPHQASWCSVLSHPSSRLASPGAQKYRLSRRQFLASYFAGTKKTEKKKILHLPSGKLKFEW